jgi:hypothetical protein
VSPEIKSIYGHNTPVILRHTDKPPLSAAGNVYNILC